jgi:hypothetical protein
MIYEYIELGNLARGTNYRMSSCQTTEQICAKLPKYAQNYRTNLRQTTERICAKLPNEFAPNYRMSSRQTMGQFILTGSAVPSKESEQEIEHTGTSGLAWLTMRPMSLFESGESNGYNA